MAFLAAVPGLEVTINVNDKPLVEYDDDEKIETLGDDANLSEITTSKYVDAVTDQEFSISYSVLEEYKQTSPALQFDFRVDGSSLSSDLVIFSDPEDIPPVVRSIHGPRTVNSSGQAYQRCFKFAAIKTAVDDRLLQSVERARKHLSQIGRVCIEVQRIDQPVEDNETIDDNFSVTDISQVHEKALKGEAKSHGVSLGHPKKVDSIPTYDAELLDDQPIACFIFQYRSIEALRQLQLIERTHESEPETCPLSPLRRESTQLTNPDIKREGVTVETRQALVKRERDENDEQVKPPKKRRLPKTKYKVKVIMDLISDSEDEAIWVE